MNVIGSEPVRRDEIRSVHLRRLTTTLRPAHLVACLVTMGSGPLAETTFQFASGVTRRLRGIFDNECLVSESIRR